ncbi:MAG: hypothetical protein F4X19_16485, partial [Acidobacteria bacterium]|nr:hypothetical protein [Acidobacteriota bacterium]
PPPPPPRPPPPPPPPPPRPPPPPGCPLRAPGRRSGTGCGFPAVQRLPAILAACAGTCKSQGYWTRAGGSRVRDNRARQPASSFEFPFGGAPARLKSLRKDRRRFGRIAGRSRREPSRAIDLEVPMRTTRG